MDWKNKQGQYEKWMVNECKATKKKISTTPTKVPDPEDSEEMDEDTDDDPNDK